MTNKSPYVHRSKIAESSSRNDERYTQESGVRLLTPFLMRKSKILCPFDKHWSAFVSVLTECGHDVTFSHIDDGIDFFDYSKSDVEDFDYIISNPPYSKKNEILLHLEKLDKPFAMIFGAVGIFESKIRFECLQRLDIELLIPQTRMKFSNPYDDKISNPPFSSWFLCHDVLPNKIEFAYLKQ